MSKCLSTQILNFQSNLQSNNSRTSSNLCHKRPKFSSTAQTPPVSETVFTDEELRNQTCPSIWTPPPIITDVRYDSVTDTWRMSSTSYRRLLALCRARLQPQSNQPPALPTPAQPPPNQQPWTPPTYITDAQYNAATDSWTMSIASYDLLSSQGLAPPLLESQPNQTLALPAPVQPQPIPPADELTTDQSPLFCGHPRPQTLDTNDPQATDPISPNCPFCCIEQYECDRKNASLACPAEKT